MQPDLLLTKLKCPRTGASLLDAADSVRTACGTHKYPKQSGVPDLRVAPDRLVIDVPWYEPWEDLDRVTYAPPEVTVSTEELPYHLDAHLASVCGEQGQSRSIVEVGCGERQCESWFEERGFQYVGTDVDIRGPGPHLLADAHNLPFQDDSFDLMTSMAVYEHLVSPLTAACEAHRVLKPGGVFFGSSAFVFCFHDRASFHHMSHAGLLYVLRVAGFEVERMWADWDYPDAIPHMGFRGLQGAPWKILSASTLKFCEWSYLLAAGLARRLAGKEPINREMRRIHNAGSISFIARKSSAPN